MPNLVIRVADPVLGLTLQRDDQSVLAAAWGTRLPVDPGTHVLTASAAGFREWKTSVTVVPGETREILVPKLEPLAVVSPPKVDPPPRSEPPAPRPPAIEPRSGLGAWPWIVGGTAVVLLGVGTWSGISALGDEDAAKRGCPSRADCPRSVLDAHDRAVTKAWVSNVSLGLGVLAAGGATWMFLRSSSEPRTGLVIGGPTVAYVGLAGSF